jgi:hypothetical protein
VDAQPLTAKNEKALLFQSGYLLLGLLPSIARHLSVADYEVRTLKAQKI